MMANIRQWLANISHQSGLIAGGIGLVFSLVWKAFNLSSVPGDPLPLMLSLSQVLNNGFFYFNWQAPLVHLAFAAALGGSAVAVFWARQNTLPSYDDAMLAGRVAAIVSTGGVALLAIDAFIVAVWYLGSAFLSVYITSRAAKLGVRIWRLGMRLTSET